MSWSAAHSHGNAREENRNEKKEEDSGQRKFGEKFGKHLEEKDRIG